MTRRAAAMLTALVVSSLLPADARAGLRAAGAAPAAAAKETRPPSPSTKERLDDQRTRVASIRGRIENLTRQLTALIADLRSLDSKVEESSGDVAAATAALQKAEDRAAAAKTVLSARAREAYKRGMSMRELGILLDARTLGEMLSASRLVKDAIAADRLAYEQSVASAQTLARKRDELTTERTELFASSRRLEQTRRKLQAALASEQQILVNAQSELAALEEERRREEAALSGPLAARRAARQIELDRKLDALLGWVRPASGSAGFVPDGLRPSGVVTTGLASWYGPGFHGRRASSGATFRQEQFTAASLVLPFGTFLKVTRGGSAVIVVITDRGPYVPGRVLDLSLAAAETVGLGGVETVRMEILVPSGSSPPFP